MALGDGIRRNVATVSPEERTRLRDAFVQLDTTKIYPDGVSYWDKQEDIHKNAHEAGQDVHSGPAFLPWHREICNRLEGLLREVDPQLSLHYWDWTTDPRATPDGQGGLVNLFTPDFMGSASGDAGPPFENFESSENAELGNGHSKIWRDVLAGAPAVASDHSILTAGDSLPPANQYHAMDSALKVAHAYAHSDYIRGSIGHPHYSFHDPFVFLLHSNVDKLWACWQLTLGREWRLDPNQVYGIDGNAPSILDNLEPWSGGTGLRPWAPPENQQVVKTSKHPSVIAPPTYDCSMVANPIGGLNPSRWAAVVKILFGVTNDAPGVVLGPDGKPLPVDPWGPLMTHVSQLSPASQDILVGVALTELGALANNSKARSEIQGVGRKVINDAMARGKQR